MEIGTYRDEDNFERINADYPDLGKYKIEVSKVIDRARAMDMCRNLNTMPSNTDKFMFSVFKADKFALFCNKKVPGFIVKRKLIIGDKVEFLSKLNVVKTLKRE